MSLGRFPGESAFNTPERVLSQREKLERMESMSTPVPVEVTVMSAPGTTIPLAVDPGSGIMDNLFVMPTLAISYAHVSEFALTTSCAVCCAYDGLLSALRKHALIVAYTCTTELPSSVLGMPVQFRLTLVVPSDVVALSTA